MHLSQPAARSRLAMVGQPQYTPHAVNAPAPCGQRSREEPRRSQLIASHRIAPYRFPPIPTDPTPSPSLSPSPSPPPTYTIPYHINPPHATLTNVTIHPTTPPIHPFHSLSPSIHLNIHPIYPSHPTPIAPHPILSHPTLSHNISTQPIYPNNPHVHSIYPPNP